VTGRLEGHQRLAAAVIAEALRDLRSGTQIQRWDAALFLRDWRLTTWCHIAGLDAALVRERVRTLTTGQSPAVSAPDTGFNPRGWIDA
jgi:hypothetical protein